MTTAQNISSTLQDVLHNRPTEMEHFTGYLLRQTTNLPSHQAVYNLFLASQTVTPLPNVK
jgi:ketopantoate reductase